jgi:hypothetical protein
VPPDLGFFVELRRIELLTSSMPCRHGHFNDCPWLSLNV